MSNQPKISFYVVFSFFVFTLNWHSYFVRRQSSGKKLNVWVFLPIKPSSELSDRTSDFLALFSPQKNRTETDQSCRFNKPISKVAQCDAASTLEDPDCGGAGFCNARGRGLRKAHAKRAVSSSETRKRKARMRELPVGQCPLSEMWDESESNFWNRGGFRRHSIKRE